MRFQRTLENHNAGPERSRGRLAGSPLRGGVWVVLFGGVLVAGCGTSPSAGRSGAGGAAQQNATASTAQSGEFSPQAFCGAIPVTTVESITKLSSESSHPESFDNTTDMSAPDVRPACRWYSPSDDLNNAYGPVVLTGTYGSQNELTYNCVTSPVGRVVHVGDAPQGGCVEEIQTGNTYSAIGAAHGYLLTVQVGFPGATAHEAARLYQVASANL